MNRKEVLKNHYEPRLERYDENSKVLDWENKDAQYKRFHAMIENLDLSGKSILDIGCGCGDLYGLLNERVTSVAYTGVDILEKMVERAEKCYPGAEFNCADIFDNEFCADAEFGCPVFDVTFTSGIFNLYAGNNEAFLKKAVPVIAQLASEYFVFNLLNPSSPDRDERYFYYDPENAVDLASDWAQDIKVVKGYLDNDYTLICRR